MKLAYSFITALAVASNVLATEDHTEHHAPETHDEHFHRPEWMSHLRVGTAMHNGKFISKRALEPHHEYQFHDHHLHMKDDHLGHDATELFLEHEHYHHDHLAYNVHSFPSCKALQTSTEHDAAVIEHLLQSAQSIAKGMEEVHKHLTAASEDVHHHHHGLWSEHSRTPCEVLEESTLIEMEMAEYLLEGALIVVKELKERWHHAGATVHADGHGHEHDNAHGAHHDAHVHPDHHDAHGHVDHHDVHGHPEHHDIHRHSEHHDVHGHPEHHEDGHHEEHHWWDIFHHDEHYLDHDNGAHPHEIHPSDHHDAHTPAHHDEHGIHHDAHLDEHGDHKEHKEQSHGWFHWFEKHSPEDLKREHEEHH